MLRPDPQVLAYVHNNPPSQLDTVVAPIAAALRRQWHGEVLVADLGQVRIWLGEQTRVEVCGREVLPGLTYARTFAGAHYDTAVSRSLAALGSRVVNSPESVALANSKFESAAVLVAAGLPVPQQVLFGSGPHPDEVAAHGELGWPRVIKANRGMGGDNVWLADDPSTVSARTTAPGPIAPWVAQRYLAEAAGSDIRVLVAGDRVLGSVERRAGHPGEFRANISQGGSPHPVTLSADEADIAVRATRAVGLTVAGVDLLRSQRGPMLTEVNANPALTVMVRTLGAPDLYDQVAAAVIGG